MMAEMTSQIMFNEDKEPMVTELIYLSSDKSGNSKANSIPDHNSGSSYPDSYNAIDLLLSSQLKQARSLAHQPYLGHQPQKHLRHLKVMCNRTLLPYLVTVRNKRCLFRNAAITQ